MASIQQGGYSALLRWFNYPSLRFFRSSEIPTYEELERTTVSWIILVSTSERSLVKIQRVSTWLWDSLERMRLLHDSPCLSVMKPGHVWFVRMSEFHSILLSHAGLIWLNVFISACRHNNFVVFKVLNGVRNLRSGTDLGKDLSILS